MLTVEACHRQTDNLVTCCRHTLHLHTAFSTDKQDFTIGAQCFDGIGYAKSGEDVATCTTATDDHSKGLVHYLSQFGCKIINNYLMMNDLAPLFYALMSFFCT